MKKVKRSIYRAARNAPYNNEKAQLIGERLELLDVVTPESVLSDAADPKSPTHDLFEWNDTKAASNWRIHTARNVVNHLLVVVNTPDGPIETKAFHSIQIESEVGDESESSSPQRIYVSLEQARRSPSLQSQIIDDARSELIAWQARYKQYRSIFSGVFEAIDALQEATI